MKKNKEVKNTNADNGNIKARRGLAKTVQDVLDFDGITKNGIIISKSYYTKLYKLIDSNFVTEPEEKQEEILEEYVKLINRFGDNVDMSIVIINRGNSMEEMIANYHIKEQGNNSDELVNAYNTIVDNKLSEGGRNDITKDKYFMLCVKSRSLTEAEEEFNQLDTILNEGVKAINKVGVIPIDCVDRLRIMSEILRGVKGVPFVKEWGKYINHVKLGEVVAEKIEFDAKKLRKDGYSIKDTIAPQVISRKDVKNCLQLAEDRFCKSYSFMHIQESLDTSFLTKATNVPAEMVTVIQLVSVPRKRAVQLVKMQNTSIKADVIKASQQAYKGGYDPSLIDEDLQKAREDAKELRDDVVNKGEKLFYVTLATTIFADSEKELEDVSKQYTAICSDFSVTPNFLIGQQKEALNTALACSRSKIIIDRMMTSKDIRALCPFNIQELQDKNGKFYGVNQISKNVIMYSRKYSKLGHGLFFGHSGTGKSFFGKGEMIANFLDSDIDEIIILDPDNEYRIVSEALSGLTIDLELNSDIRINPCDLPMEWNDKKATPLATKCDYMVGLVESIMGKGRECTSFEVNAIHKATTNMYSEYIDEMTRRHNEGSTEELDTTICPTLVDFYGELLALQTPEGNKLANQIEPFCIGQYNMFAYRTNVELNNRVIVYNLLYLPEKMKEMAMKVCQSNIWSKIVKNREENIKNGTNKTLWVYLDEFHKFLTSEASATAITDWYKRGRKYGAIITGITQDCSDLLRSPQGTSIFSNTGFFVFLNQSPVGRQHLQNLYEISDTLIDYIKDKPAGTGLIYNNAVMIPFDYKIPTDNALYRIMSTNPNDKK